MPRAGGHCVLPEPTGPLRSGSARHRSRPPSRPRGLCSSAARSPTPNEQTCPHSSPPRRPALTPVGTAKDLPPDLPPEPESSQGDGQGVGHPLPSVLRQMSPATAAVPRGALRQPLPLNVRAGARRHVSPERGLACAEGPNQRAGLEAALSPGGRGPRSLKMRTSRAHAGLQTVCVHVWKPCSNELAPSPS